MPTREEKAEIMAKLKRDRATARGQAANQKNKGGGGSRPSKRKSKRRRSKRQKSKRRKSKRRTRTRRK